MNSSRPTPSSCPSPTKAFDCITIAFGLRNVTEKDTALRSMLRVLKPGGRLLVLEFSKPQNDLLSKAYDTYSFRLLPLMGKLVANDADSYQYLAESIRMHPDQETLKGMMEDAGFDRVEFHNMTGGIVALHKGIKELKCPATSTQLSTPPRWRHWKPPSIGHWHCPQAVPIAWQPWKTVSSHCTARPLR